MNLDSRPLALPGGVKPSKLKIKHMAEIIMLNRKFAIDESHRLYYYDGTVYKEDKGFLCVRRMYKRMLEELEIAAFWKDTDPDKIVKYIIPEVPMLLDRPDVRRVNLLNGIFYIGDGESASRFESHEEYDHSAYLTTVQIPINYDPAATCSYWDEFLVQLFPVDPDLLVQLIGMCMIPFVGLQKCILLMGDGSNGKSTLLDLMQVALGHENCASMSLKQLTGKDSRFNHAGLVGRLVDIAGDIPDTKMEDEGKFKALTGHDSIQVEFKGRQPYFYRPFARLIFSCNSRDLLRLSSEDESVGYKRRFFCIPFDQTFEVDPKKQRELHENLSDPSELSGLFNKIAAWLPSIIEHGLDYNDAAQEKVRTYMPMPNFFKDWASESFIPGEGYACTEESAFDSYTTSGIPGTANREPKHIYKMLRTMYPGIFRAVGYAGRPNKRGVEQYQREKDVYVGLHLIKSNISIDRVHYYFNTAGEKVGVSTPSPT